MSRINIQGIIDDIKGHSTIYTPILEAIVNSIQSLESGEIKDGVITVELIRPKEIDFDNQPLPDIKSIIISDNGVGFNDLNRESFDTFRTDTKKKIGGKGFGRFMYLKYFNSVKIESNYSVDNGGFYTRSFAFGRKFDIIVDEKKHVSKEKVNSTVVYLTNILDKNKLDKNLNTIARKLLEKLLIFFIDEEFICPKIIIKDNYDNKELILNEFLKSKKEIELVHSDKFDIESETSKEIFQVKIFKIYYSTKKSKISLAAQKREVTDTSIEKYIPEFSEDFYEEVTSGGKVVKRNFIIKTYVTGEYLTNEASTERDVFNFPKEKSSVLYPFSQKEIEQKAAEITREFFKSELKSRSEKKSKQIINHVDNQAPWHKPYLNEVDFTDFPYNASSEQIESQLQKYKFKKEQETRIEVQQILTSEKDEYDELLEDVVSKITSIGKSDLAHYVSSRKVILDLLNKMRKRKDDGSAEYEEDIHNLIYPMGADSTNTKYEDHNLWLLDERLVFSSYIASDRKINKTDSLTEPDLVVFDKLNAFRTGENSFSNPLTIYEFKRPKRTAYSDKDDPINQVTNYLSQIRKGKYELPEGLEKVKINDSTPVYAYVVADMCDKIDLFAKRSGLTKSADDEGYFGYLSGFSCYIEILSFKKMAEDAEMRNKIFFKKLQLT